MSEMIPTVEERYRLLVEGARDYAMILLDVGGRITSWNTGAQRIMGWAEAEVLDHPVDLIFTPEDCAAAVPAREIERAVTDGKAMDQRWHLKKDGTRFFADGIMEGIRGEDGHLRGFAKIMRDATEHTRTERRLQRLFDSQVVGIIFWNLDTGLITDANEYFLSMVGYTRDDLAAGLLDFRKMTPPEWQERNDEGLAAIREIGSAPTYEKEYFRKDGSRVPILISGTRFEESEADGFSFILDITEQQRREERERTRLNDIFMQAPAFMATLRGHEHVFEMANPPYLQLVGHRDILGKPVAVALPEVVEQGFIDILDQVYRTGEPFIGTNVRILLQVTPNSPPEERYLDFVYQPLHDEDRNVSGILAHGIDLTERNRLEIEQQRLLDEAQARAEEQRVLAQREALVNRIGAALRGSSDLEEAKEMAAALLGEALGADRCYFALYDLAAGIVRISRDWHREDLPSVQGTYPFTNTVEMFRELYQDSNASVIVDAYTSSLSAQTRANMESLQLRSRVSVALADAAGLTATLTAAMSDAPRDWTAEEMSLVEAAATQLRIGMEAAQIQQREHRIAEQLQAALTPSVPERVPGLVLADYYRPAWDDQGVGGDFIDVFATDKGMSFLVVGDLSGKGLAAASQVATVRNMLRFALYNGRTVAGPVSSLNDTLADNDLLSGFTTLFVGRYEAQTRELTYANCGQDAGLVLRAATGRIEPLPPTGPVLGAISGAAYLEERVVLEAGDVLAIYTDGLTEAGPSRAALLTGDGVADLLRKLPEITEPQAVVEGLMAGVDAHAGSGVRDDQCLLVGIVTSPL